MTSLNKDRRAARELALDVLYQAEVNTQTPREALARLRSDAATVAPLDALEQQAPSDAAIAYAIYLVEGVHEHNAEIDRLIDLHAERWTLKRMPLIDKSLLRVAVFELLWGDDVPTAVVINEAIELAKRFSTPESGAFVNGLLGKIATSPR